MLLEHAALEEDDRSCPVETANLPGIEVAHTHYLRRNRWNDNEQQKDRNREATWYRHFLIVAALGEGAILVQRYFPRTIPSTRRSGSNARWANA